CVLASPQFLRLRRNKGAGKRQDERQSEMRSAHVSKPNPCFSRRRNPPGDSIPSAGRTPDPLLGTGQHLNDQLGNMFGGKQSVLCAGDLPGRRRAKRVARAQSAMGSKESADVALLATTLV